MPLTFRWNNRSSLPPHTEWREVEGGWREAFTTTFLGVVDIQEKSRVHSACMQSSGGAQSLCAEVGAEPRRS